MSSDFAEFNRSNLHSQAAHSVLVIPCGATEQHGPHLPVGTDTFTAQHIAGSVAKLLQDVVPVLLSPPLSFGSSAHHIPFGGTLSLSTTTYYRVLVELGESAIASGFRRIFFLNGHAGNHELVQLAARDLSLGHSVAVGAGSWWIMAGKAISQADRDGNLFVPGHAGAVETSVILALRPDLVGDIPARPAHMTGRRSSFSDFRSEFHGSWQAIEGYTDHPETASRELGKELLERVCEKVADDFRKFYEASGAAFAQSERS